MFRLVATDESRRAAESLVRFLEQLPRRILSEGRRPVQTAVLRGFQRNFSAQTSGGGAPWQPLRLVTQRDRQRKGYAGARPILVRSGAYRSALVNAADANHLSHAGMDGNAAVFEEGSAHELTPYHEDGTRRMPARSATELNAASVDEVGRVLDWVVTQIERRMVR